MKIHLQIGWNCQFIVSEKQLAQLMPLIEQLHYVEDHYVEGYGRVFSHKEFSPTIEIVKQEKIYTKDEVDELKKEKQNGNG